MLAVGRRDPSVRLAEPSAGRETATRSRLPLEALQLRLDLDARQDADRDAVARGR